MTPLQFAKAECSNYEQSNGSCKGIGIKDDGSLYSFGAKPQCVLGTKGVRCLFFEECVAPLANRVEQPIRAHEYKEAVTEYRITANVPKTVDRSCPGCGRELEPKKRLCYVCRKQARKASTRRAVSKTRNQAESDVSS